MLDISAAAKIEKNKLAADGVWLVLLEIIIPVLNETLRLVRNTDNITWRGYTWTAFPFVPDDINEDSKGELQTLAIKVSNVTRTVQYYLEQGDGGIGASVKLYVIHSKHLELAQAEFEETFEITSTSADAHWVTFSLGPGYPLMARRPERRILKNFCQFVYGGTECAVSAAVKLEYPSCNKSLADCRKRGNSVRYGGEPSIPAGGTFI